MSHRRITLFAMFLLGSLNVSFAQELYPFSPNDRPQREAYGGEGVFEKLYFKRTPTGPVEYNWVHTASPNPRFVGPHYFDSLSNLPHPKGGHPFEINRLWRFHWITVRFMRHRWREFDTYPQVGQWDWGHQLGGYLVTCNAKGLFLGDGANLMFIPYAAIRNVRKGHSMRDAGDFAVNESGAGLIVVPAATAVHNVRGLSPSKVHRTNGDPSGNDFPEWVNSHRWFSNSQFTPNDFPLVMISEGRRDGHVISRYNTEEFVLTDLEQMADRVVSGNLLSKKNVMHTDEQGNLYQKRKSILNSVLNGEEYISKPNTMGIPMLILESDTAVSPPVKNDTPKP